MQRLPLARWWLWTATFTVAALAAASAGYWGLKLLTPWPASPGPAPLTPTESAVDPQRVSRALGGGRSPATGPVVAVPDATAGRFKLAGVVADRHARGYALIAVDGKPARPFRVGSTVSDTLLLQSVSKGGAVLAASVDGPSVVRLDMPKLNPP